MRNRVHAYLALISSTIIATMVVAAPASAAGLGEARRRIGFGSVLGTLCCLFVVALIVGGIFIGVRISRRRGGPR